MDGTDGDADQPSGKDAWESEVESLKEQIRRLKMERAVLEGTVEIVRRDRGADPRNLANTEKTLLIDALRPAHRLIELREYLRISKSSYCTSSRHSNSQSACLRRRKGSAVSPTMRTPASPPRSSS